MQNVRRRALQIIRECQQTTISRPGASSSWTTCFLKADFNREHGSVFLETLTMLFDEAKQDFPGLEEKDVIVTRLSPLSGPEAAMADKVGPVSFDAIQFLAPAEPPASYTRLPPQLIKQG